MQIILIICLIIYVAMIFSVKYRTAVATIGVGILLIYGTFSGSYPVIEAFHTFPIEIVVLIISLALFSKIFENNGFFKYIGDKFLKLSKGRKIFIAIMIPFTMYATSLFMNNLSVILLFTFICIELAINLQIPIIPILVSGLIASNIGGCPLPWADTPAVILTLYSDFTLIDFLTKLFIPCLIYIGLLILYTIWWFKREQENPKKSRQNSDKKSEIMPIKPPKHHGPPHPPPPPPPHVIGLKHCHGPRWKTIYVPIIMFVIFITAICVSPFLNISIAYVSMLFIGLMLFLTPQSPEEIINSLPVLDSLTFISALFMIAGVLQHAGILKKSVDYIISFTGNNKILILLCIMLSAFLISTFLSAGPAAATILPICQQLSPMVGNRLVYAALALGILAGSSMLPWSATGGPVMFSEVGRFLNTHKVSECDKIRIKEIYNLKHYISFSIPFSLVILAIGALFLVLYSLLI